MVRVLGAIKESLAVSSLTHLNYETTCSLLLCALRIQGNKKGNFQPSPYLQWQELRNRVEVIFLKNLQEKDVSPAWILAQHPVVERMVCFKFIAAMRK